MGNEYVTIDEAAALEGKSRATMWVWIRRHQLPTYRFTGDRKTYIRREDMQRFRDPIRRESKETAARTNPDGGENP